MAASVEIDPGAGFCGGVIRAITGAEKFLSGVDGGTLYSLGHIVHNGEELARLRDKGLVTIEAADLTGPDGSHEGQTLLIRAHGEPPSTYARARALGFSIADYTCPVVLRLQQSIRHSYAALQSTGGTLVIYGKIGHAEVLGLLGQVDGDAVVVEGLDMLREMVSQGRIPTDSPVEIFSQTTGNPEEYARICGYLRSQMSALLTVHDTICTQVASRHKRLETFALEHDVVVFVCGRMSSNGAVLSSLCRSVNVRTYQVESAADIHPEWFRPEDRVGVSGATSTPKWLLEEVALKIENFAR